MLGTERRKLDKNMEEKQKKRADNKKYTLHLTLENWGTIVDKVLCRQRIQVCTNLEQVLMLWLIKKNFAELK